MAIDWRNEPVIDSVQLPGSETKYWVQDTEAREKIETLANATHFIGVSTTEITDGGTEKPTINEEEVNPVAGDIVIWKPLTGAPLEFIWDGSKWNLLGGQALEGLGDLAFKDSAEGSYTPEGNVSLQTDSITAITSLNLSTLLTNVNISTSSLGAGTDISLNVSLSGSISTLTMGQEDAYIIDFSGDDVATNIVTTGVSVIGSFSNDGYMPTINNTNTITASVSGNTLIFGLSDIGFTSGTFSTPIEVDVVQDAYAELTSVTRVALNTTNLDVSNITGTTKFYWNNQIDYLDVDTTTFDLPVSATFSGSSTAITVS